MFTVQLSSLTPTNQSPVHSHWTFVWIPALVHFVSTLKSNASCSAWFQSHLVTKEAIRCKLMIIYFFTMRIHQKLSLFLNTNQLQLEAGFLEFISHKMASIWTSDMPFLYHLFEGHAITNWIKLISLISSIERYHHF